MSFTGLEWLSSLLKVQACIEGMQHVLLSLENAKLLFSVEGSQLTRSDKRLWKRIWWTLFSRDRSVAVALGRPVGINPEDTDVEMITEDDFIEDEPDRPAELPPDPIHIHFFINYVKLCEIMGLVLAQQYSVASKYKRTNAIDLTHSDMALADWFQRCPKEVSYDKNNHNFWAALLHANY
jgi:Fungal specific transcription factor domain